MPVRSQTDAIDSLHTTTWENMQSTIADNIFDATPFFAYLKKKGKLDMKVGGRQITYPLRYKKSEQTGWIKKGGTVPLTDIDFLTSAFYEWKTLYGSMVQFREDDQQNAGKAELFDLVQNKIEVTQDSLVDDIETMLFAATTTDAPDGLQSLVPDDPTTGTVGGINSATHSWWRSKTKDMTGSSFATNGEDEMATMFNNVSNGRKNERPDILLSGQTVYEYVESSQNQYKVIQQQDLLEMGFDHILYKKVPLFYSPACGTRLYFLNTNYMKFVIDKRYNFRMTKWKEIPNQPEDRAAQILLTCALATNRRRCLGVMHTIDTP